VIIENPLKEFAHKMMEPICDNYEPLAMIFIINVILLSLCWALIQAALDGMFDSVLQAWWFILIAFGMDIFFSCIMWVAD